MAKWKKNIITIFIVPILFLIFLLTILADTQLGPGEEKGVTNQKIVSTLMSDGSVITDFGGGQKSVCYGCANDYLNVSLVGDSIRAELNLVGSSSCTITPLLTKKVGSALSPTSLKTEIQQKEGLWSYNHTMNASVVESFSYTLPKEAVWDGNKLLCNNFVFDFNETINKQGFSIEKVGDELKLVGDLNYIDPTVTYTSTSLFVDMFMYQTVTDINDANGCHAYYKWNLGPTFDRQDYNISNATLQGYITDSNSDSDVLVYLIPNQSIDLVNGNVVSVFSTQAVANTTHQMVDDLWNEWGNINVTSQLKQNLNNTTNHNFTLRLEDPDYPAVTPTDRENAYVGGVMIGSASASKYFDISDKDISTKKPKLNITYTDFIELSSPSAEYSVYSNTSFLLSINSTTTADYAIFYSLDNGPNITMCNNCNGTNSSINATYGNHTLRAYAMTSTGTVFSESVSFNVSMHGIVQPHIRPLIIYSNTTINVSTVVNGSKLSYNVSFQFFNETSNGILFVPDYNLSTTCGVGNCSNSSTSSFSFRHFENWTVSVRAFNGSSWSNSVNSTPFFINNSKPSTNNPSISPGAPTTLDDLSCVNTTIYDADDDALTVFYDWLNSTDGASYVVANISSSVLDKANLSNGAYWKCRLWVSDSFSTSNNYTSGGVVIGLGDNIPVIDSGNASTNSVISTATNPSNNNSAIDFQLNFSDADSDTASIYVCKSNSFGVASKCVDGEFCHSDFVSPGATSCSLNDLTNLSSQQYTWYAFANSSANNLVSSSFSGTFNVNHYPVTIEVSSPTNQTIYGSTQNSVTINWDTSSDVDGDTVTYIVYGSTSNNPSTILLNTTSTSYGWGIGSGNSYFWKIQTKDSHNYKNPTNSSVYMFSIESEAGGTNPPGGGGSTNPPPTTPVEEQIEQILQSIAVCGNLKCDEGETLFSCPKDCTPNLDDLLGKSGRDIWKEAGFLTTMFIIVGVAFVFMILRSKKVKFV